MILFCSMIKQLWDATCRRRRGLSYNELHAIRILSRCMTATVDDSNTGQLWMIAILNNELDRAFIQLQDANI